MKLYNIKIWKQEAETNVLRASTTKQSNRVSVMDLRSESRKVGDPCSILAFKLVKHVLGTLTSINILTNLVLDRALISNRHILLRNRATAIIEALRFTHGTLERIALPAKHIISMRSVPGALEAPHERIRIA